MQPQGYGNNYQQQPQAYGNNYQQQPQAYGNYYQQPHAMPQPAQLHQMAYAPSQMQFGMGGGLKLLSGAQSIFIKEEARTAEVVCGVDMNNRYKVLDQNKVQTFFLAEEDSTCCERNCYPRDCRPFNLNLKNHNGSVFIRAEKPCQPTFLCFNRPTMQVRDNETQRVIGYIKDPWECCYHGFSIQDQTQKDVLVVKGSCLQCGLYCPLPCGPCKDVRFHVRDATNENIHVGEIVKENTCMGSFCTDQDNYYVSFGSIQNDEWKGLLLTTALFIDTTMFSRKHDD